MYPGEYASQHPDRAAFVMASTGESVSYREFEERSNRLAHLLRSHGLGRLDHYSIFMENNDRYLEACAAGERAGLYYTCVNSYLTSDELAYIVQNSDSQVLITSRSRLAVATETGALVAAVGVTPVDEGVGGGTAAHAHVHSRPGVPSTGPLNLPDAAPAAQVDDIGGIGGRGGVAFAEDLEFGDLPGVLPEQGLEQQAVGGPAAQVHFDDVADIVLDFEQDIEVEIIAAAP